MTAPLGQKSKAINDAVHAIRTLFLQAFGASFFVNLLMLTGPIYMLQMYDRVLSSQSYETLAVITILVFFLFTAMAGLDFARGALLSRAGLQFENKLKKSVFDASMEAARLGVPGAEQPLRDLRQVRQLVSTPAFAAVFDAPWTPLFLAIIFMMHGLLGVVALFGLIILLVLAFTNERASRNANKEAQSKSTHADKMAMSTLRNNAAADSMGMRGVLRKRWLQMTDASADQSMFALDTTGGLGAASKAMRLFLQSAILGTGAFLAIQGQVTPGVMIAASIITGRALAPIEMITGQWRNFALTQNAYRRLDKFISATPKERERTELPVPAGALSVEKLYCQPGGAKAPVVKNASFKLAAGTALGIVGPSAAGKSTLAKALVGVERVASGVVRLDGADITHWDPDALGKHIGYLPQEVELFSGTAAQNIARFSEDADPSVIIEAAMAAGAHEMVLSFSDGYETQIGDQGRHLSSGQRQRLGLARALFGSPALVVLDEPNANLDTDGDAALAEAVQGLKARGATTIIVAHRPSAIAFVDKLLMLASGEVRAFGPRDEILEKIAPQQVTPFRGPNAPTANKA